MKKIIILLLAIFSFNSLSVSKETTFTNELFKKSQLDGKTVIIHSWNKTCSTCAKQVKILDKAKQDFKDVIFLSFEQTKDKEIAKFFNVSRFRGKTFKRFRTWLFRLYIS